MCADECCGKVEAYVDSNWAPERNNHRKSLLGCVIFVDHFPVKAFTRQQTSVALSSAEAELMALTEGAKEAVGLVSLVQHVFGPARTSQDPPDVFSDSQAAINIGSMHGLLRRVRHIDLRVCWVQAAIQDRLITLSWLPGTQNPADLFTKALSKPAVHLDRLGIVESQLRLEGLASAIDFDVIRLCLMLGKVVNQSALERLSCQLDDAQAEKTRWVVVEFCTSVNSGMKRVAANFSFVEVVCVTEDENGLLDETIAALRSGIVRLVELGARVLAWSSAPPSLKTARQQPREPEESDSDQEVVRFECDTNRKYYVSSSGSKLHLFQDCWGRYSRVTSYKLCVNCANRAAEVPTLRTRVSTVRSRRPNSKRG
eukprot:s52_g37.t1